MCWHPLAYTLPPVLIGTAAIVILQPQTVAVALQSVEVSKVAKSITVLIRGNGVFLGSGVLIQKEGNTYTVLTARHVVSGSAQYELETPDGKRYDLNGNTIKPLSSAVDLAVVGFSSGTTYSLATIGDSNQVQEESTAYVAGFPQLSLAITEPVYTFTEGKITANATRPLADGYALVYNNNTLPGMSGGLVLDANGKLIAIHGRVEGTTEVRQTETVKLKTGFNLGIPINTFVGLAPQMNIALAGVAPLVPRVIPPQLTAADYFLQGGEKYQRKDFKGAIADYTKVIRLDPSYVNAYNNRGNTRSEIGDKIGAISDYNEALRLNPKDINAYNNRGATRSALGDKVGAIAD
ncbi:MAG: trypsin-like peptidase domain-containing protein [Synechococcales cyanobacterium]